MFYVYIIIYIYIIEFSNVLLNNKIIYIYNKIFKKIICNEKILEISRIFLESKNTCFFQLKYFYNLKHI